MREIKDHDFVARGELYRDDLSVSVTIRGTYSEFEHKPVKCLVIPDKTDQSFKPFFDGHNLGHLRGIAQDGEDIWISDLTSISSSGHKDSFYWEGIADVFIKGNLEEFDATNGEIYCELFIPATPLVEPDSFNLNFDGTISFENSVTEKTGIFWRTKYGNAQLVDGYYYANQQIGIDAGVVRVQRCRIAFKTRLQDTVNLKDILNDCSDVFDNTLWLLSLLSRKRLTYYFGNALFVPDKDSKTAFQKAIVCRNKHLGYENSMGYGEYGFDLLIRPSQLKTDLFQDLLANYNNSKFYGSIRRAIIYVLMTYERAYFEAYIGIIYLGLETLVAGTSSDKDRSTNKVLDANSFRDLVGQLNRVIKGEVKISQDSDTLIKNLEKINYIESSSFADRLLSLLRQYNVPFEKLWVHGADVEAMLREIIKRRNLYIHKGEIGDFDQYLSDFARLRTLVELWILKLLDCDNDFLAVDSLSNLMPIGN